ncbi:MULTISPECIES: MerR family transcriptional regulator [Streptomyces]|uniref:MerR family transcriptional regulator n=1 Tax=Streptomyces TaxID=1883 RepID=UPI000D1992D8|nr:MerR family transcriptional regulator [Streptomyces kasugaensis]
MRIGELAALVGVSTRTVRHYHHLGLLPEPARRANGYREYGIRDAAALARVRRLTELGLCLEEVRDVLADDAGRELRDVLVELDADLARQEEAIRARRVRLGALLRQADEHGGLPDEGPVSEQLAELFAEMARTSATLPGPEPAMAAKEREGLALLETITSPGELAPVMATLRETFAGPGAMERAYEVYALLDGLADAAPDDPRVAEVARALADCLPRRLVAEGATAVESALEREWRGGGADDGGSGGAGVMGAVLADLAPAQAAAVRQTIRLIGQLERESRGSQASTEKGAREL